MKPRFTCLVVSIVVLSIAAACTSEITHTEGPSMDGIACRPVSTTGKTKTITLGGKAWTVPEVCCVPDDGAPCFGRKGGKQTSCGCPQNGSFYGSTPAGFALESDGCVHALFGMDPSRSCEGIPPDAGGGPFDVRDSGRLDAGDSGSFGDDAGDASDQ